MRARLAQWRPCRMACDPNSEMPLTLMRPRVRAESRERRCSQTASVRHLAPCVREAKAGEAEGRNERPVPVGVLLGRSRSLFPISTKQPEALRIPTETPALDRRRARLVSDPSVWIILDAFNTDRVGQSFNVDPQSVELPIQRDSLPAMVRGFIARRERVRCAQTLPTDIRAAVLIGRGVRSIFRDVLPFCA